MESVSSPLAFVVLPLDKGVAVVLAVMVIVKPDQGADQTALRVAIAAFPLRRFSKTPPG